MCIQNIKNGIKTIEKTRNNTGEGRLLHIHSIHMTKIVDTVFLNFKDIDHKNPQ